MSEQPHAKESFGSVAGHAWAPGPEFEREWRERFAEFANLRDDDAGIAGWSITGLETRFRFFRRVWRAPVPGSTYLDVGCGAGTYSRWLAQQALRVVGIDYSLPTLQKATARSGASVSFCVANATRLPVANASFDGALCLGVLQALRDSEPIIAELARVIRDGGALWIDALNYHGIAGWWDRTRRRLRGKSMHLRYESATSLVEALLRAGFARPEVHWLPLMPSQLQMLQPLFECSSVRRLLSSMPPIASTTSHSFLIAVERRTRVTP
jgi:2-polyprenyl-3-methyl-5-hydroxy-6-metoxy-1,4-benzoquinol methylase